MDCVDLKLPANVEH